MAKPRKLTDEQIEKRLEKLEGWTYNGKVLRRKWKLKGFISAMRFVNKVAREAERMDHHPDIDIRYDTVTMSLATHFVGGITKLDFTLAGLIDDAAPQADKPAEPLPKAKKLPPAKRLKATPILGKPVADKPAARKAPAKKTPAEKAAAKTATAKKATAGKTAAKSTAASKPAAKKAAAKKSAAKK